MGAPKGDGAASCPAGTAYHERVRRGGGGESVACLDALARAVRTATRGFDGKWVHVDTEYDALGRVRRASEPHYAGETQCSKAQGDSRCWTTDGPRHPRPDRQGHGPRRQRDGVRPRGLRNHHHQRPGPEGQGDPQRPRRDRPHGGPPRRARSSSPATPRATWSATTRRKPAADASPGPGQRGHGGRLRPARPHDRPGRPGPRAHRVPIQLAGRAPLPAGRGREPHGNGLRRARAHGLPQGLPGSRRGRLRNAGPGPAKRPRGRRLLDPRRRHGPRPAHLGGGRRQRLPPVAGPRRPGPALRGGDRAGDGRGRPTTRRPPTTGSGAPSSSSTPAAPRPGSTSTASATPTTPTAIP